MPYTLNISENSIRIQEGSKIIAYVPGGSDTKHALRLLQLANSGAGLDHYMDKYVQQQIIVHD